MSGTTQIVETYVYQLQNPDLPDEAVERLVRDLLAEACQRLQKQCEVGLHRDYPRLLKHPYNVNADELLSGVVERLIKSLRNARPTTARAFFKLAQMHLRWELNEIARAHDDRPPHIAQCDVLPAHDSESCLSMRAQQILAAIEQLPVSQREVFELVRIQGLTQLEVAAILAIDERSVRRRLNQALFTLTELLDP